MLPSEVLSLFIFLSDPTKQKYEIVICFVLRLILHRTCICLLSTAAIKAAK